MASLAGLSRPEADFVDEIAEVDAENSYEAPETVEPPALLETMLNALDGRVKTDEGEPRPLEDGSSLAGVADAGCWRTAKTKVLFTARREHCGCMMYKSWRWACGVGWRKTKSYEGFSPVWVIGRANARG